MGQLDRPCAQGVEQPSHPFALAEICYQRWRYWPASVHESDSALWCATDGAAQPPLFSYKPARRKHTGSSFGHYCCHSTSRVLFCTKGVRLGRGSSGRGSMTGLGLQSLLISKS
ncbi:hypothetical protein L484_019332 [Morus notabilis]|uniref:Uncharacterized protein n=1 Tax=Morus notabilis TaxID=981085 RepID=W9QP28_9ROSA|nr:hypothetical protein L484_019332 [Morus notabilis]